MRAYINVLSVDRHADGRPGGYVAEVVSSQDYHDGGPFARSHKTDPYTERQFAYTAAEAWAKKNEEIELVAR